MANVFHQLQIRLGTGIALKLSPAASYQDFEADLMATVRRPAALSLEDAQGMCATYLIARNRKDKEAEKRASDNLYRARNRARQKFFADTMGSRVGFGDRLVLFWTDHFVIRPSRVEQHGFFSHHQDAIRSTMHRTFYDLLCAAVLHPSMVLYLNQESSAGPGSSRAKARKEAGLNENLARELLELHTLGVRAKYNQNDVHQTALLLSGLRFTKEKGVHLDKWYEEPGVKTILGKRYPESSDGTLNHIRALLFRLANHPQTVTHICRKMAIHFCSDKPVTALIRDLKSEWVRTRGNLTMVYRVLVRHPAVIATRAQKVKRPADFVISGLRAIGCSPNHILPMTVGAFNYWVLSKMTPMGQDLYNVGGPNGWPENAAAWITPSAYASRISWAHNCPSAVMGKDLPAATVSVSKALAGTGSQELRLAVSRAPSLKESVTVLLASSEFNRR